MEELAKVQENHTRISRIHLLSEIKQNRKVHQAAYEDAIYGWRTDVLNSLRKHQEKIDLLARRIEADIEADKPVKTLDVRNLCLEIPPRPECHTSDYDGLIKRLEMSMDEIIWLSHKDFKKFVLDEWEWKELFLAQISNYSANLSNDYSV